MGKDTNFIGQPIFGQLLNFLDKGHIKRVSRELEADKYVKKFTSYKHVVVMLFAVFEGYHSIRDTVLGLLSCKQATTFGFRLYCSSFHFIRCQCSTPT